MTILEAQQQATQKLKNSESDSPAQRSFSEGGPALDAEILLAFVLKKPKEYLLTHPEQKLTDSQLTAYNKLIKRRAKHEPIAYITGHKDFYGLDFLVNKDVLIPRPETELMVEEILKTLIQISPLTAFAGPRQRRWLQGEVEGVINIIDVGTGSGCVPIAIAKSLLMSSRATAGSRGISQPSINAWDSSISPPAGGSSRNDKNVAFFATDISSSALKLARQNAKRHGVNKQITFLQGNLLVPFFKNLKSEILNLKSSVITANLPYLPRRPASPNLQRGEQAGGWKKWKNNTSAETAGLKFEPSVALFTKENGLYLYRQLFEQIKNLSTYNFQLTTFNLLIEFDPRQKKELKKLIKKYFPKANVKIKKDLAGLDRLAIIKL